MMMHPTLTKGLSLALATIMAGFLLRPADAQQGQWAFGETPDEEGRRITALQDGSTIGCGDQRIFRHDASGNVMWMLSVDGYSPETVIVTSDGGFASAGAYFNGTNSDTLLVKLDAGGNVSWMHLYPGSHYDEECELIEVETGGYLIVDAWVSPQDGFRVPFVIRAKPDGTEDWMYRYLPVGYNAPHGEFAFVEPGVSTDGELVFNMVGALADGGISGKRDTLLTRIDEFGNELTSHTIGFDQHNDWGRGLTRAANGGFLVTGYSKEFGEGGGTYLMHVFDDFTLDWYTGIYGLTGTKEIYQNSLNEAIICGSLGYPNPVTNAALLAIDPSNQTLSWGMQYGESDSDWAKDFCTTSNGYILLGSTKSFDIFPNQDFYYIMTDFMGISGCFEEPYTPSLDPLTPPEKTVTLERHLVEPIQQVKLEWGFVNFKERALCDDPGDPCVCVDPPPGMTSWWTLDESSGSTSSDSISSFDGSWIGNPTPITGMVDGALLFDGVDDYVSVPYNTFLDVGPSTAADGDFTIDAWIRIDGPDPMDFGPIAGMTTYCQGFAFYVRDDRLELACSDGPLQGVHLSLNTIPHDEWVHVAVVADRPGLAKFYINGVEENAAPGSTFTLAGLGMPSSPFEIGRLPRFCAAMTTVDMYFEGGIDEVEFFHRALDATEIQAIHDAQECGKCKFDCDVPWDEPFCIDDTKIITTVTVCNYGTVPATIDLSFGPINPPDCGNIPGPTNFTVVSPGNPVTVPANGCVNVDVSIERPVQMNSLFDIGCYEVTLTNQANGHTNTCRGSVQDRRDLCPDTEDPVIELEPGVIREVDIQITNTGVDDGVIIWAALVYGPDMLELSRNISVNGNEAGGMVVGEAQIPFGETRVLSFELRAEFYEGNSRSDLVLNTLAEGDQNQLRPLQSVSLTSGRDIDLPCPGDFNGDGVINGADLSYILGSWGECEGCNTDLNGDGIVNGADLAIILGLWGDCP